MPDEVISMAVQVTGVEKAKADIRSIGTEARKTQLQMQTASRLQGPQYWQYMNQGMGDRWYISRQDAADRFARRQAAMDRLGRIRGAAGTGLLGMDIGKNIGNLRGSLGSLGSTASLASLAVLGLIKGLGSMKKIADDFAKLSPKEQLAQEMDEDYGDWLKRGLGTGIKKVGDKVRPGVWIANLLKRMAGMDYSIENDPMVGRSLKEMREGRKPLSDKEGFFENIKRYEDALPMLKEMAPLNEEEMRRAVRDGMLDAMREGKRKPDSPYTTTKNANEMWSRSG